jgi:hypothetical protein
MASAGRDKKDAIHVLAAHVADHFHEALDTIRQSPQEVDVSRRSCGRGPPGGEHQRTFEHELVGMLRDAKPIQEPLHCVILKHLLEGTFGGLRDLEQSLSNGCREISDLALRHSTASM